MKHQLLTAAFLLASLVPAGTAAAEQTFSIVQDLPAITHVDVGAEGSSHGDIMAFEAPFTADDGTTGIISGMVITVDIEIGDGGHFLDRIVQIVVDFGASDTLVIGGSTEYPSGEAEMAQDAPQLRAVVGGTGRFIGARGQVLTTRRDAGHYEHSFTLLD
jgi:opacity protein-like surface antigen